MPTLYGVARSRASRPLWLLIEAGVPFDQVPVVQHYRLPDPAPPGALHTRSPEFLKVNPQGQVPAWEEDGLVLTESLAICLHIARRHGGELGPRDWKEDAEALNWALVAATGVEPGAYEILAVAMAGQKDTPEGQARMQAGAGTLARTFARLEAHLAANDWLMGGRFTVADIMVAECVRYAQPYPPALEPYPALSAWLARCQARPGFKAMLERRNAEPA